MVELLGDGDNRVGVDSTKPTDENRVGVDSTEENRVRVDLAESTDEKRVRVDLVGVEEKKRVRDEYDDDESGQESPEAKRLKDDLLGENDDSDPDPESLDLDSVMKSFECELSASVNVEGSVEPQPDLGYLLEASDDELGLPPPPSAADSATELVRLSSDSSGVGEFWGFDDPISSYDSFDLGTGDVGYVTVDGLFEYSDVCFDSSDLFSHRQESLPAE